MNLKKSIFNFLRVQKINSCIPLSTLELGTNNNFKKTTYFKSVDCELSEAVCGGFSIGGTRR